jgi:glycosyltransferase involved in cell wall biosynthesis
VRIRWEGDVFVWSSLALINREVTQRLAARPETSVALWTGLITVDPESEPEMRSMIPLLVPLDGPADVHVRHQWPFSSEPPPEGRWVVMQHWEFGSLPRAWLQPMREEIDEVWVASQFVWDTFVSSGVPRERVVVVPCGVDTQLFTDEGPDYPLPDKKGFTFLFVGGTIARKGVDLLLHAYHQAFRPDDDVALVIKELGGKSFYQGQSMADQIARIHREGSTADIVLIEDELTPDRLAALYRSVDCLVHPYRGEGFGLPIAEAMACGKPVIVPNYGACLDFCSPETAYLVPAQVIRDGKWDPSNLETVHHPFWCEVDIDALAAAMRYVYDNRDEAQAKGKLGQAIIRERFTWEIMADRVAERLQAVMARPARRLAQQIAPFHIEGRKGTAFVILPDWADPASSWQDALRQYLTTFGAADDVSLILYVPPDGPVSLEALEPMLMAVIASLGVAEDEIADLIVLPEPLERPDHSDLLAATEVYVPTGENLEPTHRQLAILYGRQVLGGQDPAAWRSAMAART